jgi:hypothetical protein
MGRQFGPERANQRPHLVVDRAFALKMLVVAGDFQHPLAGPVSPLQHVLEKWNDVVPLFRSAEADDQEGVAGRFNDSQSIAPEFVRASICKYDLSSDPTGGHRRDDR